MTRLDKYIVRRHEIANRYNAELANLPITRPWQSPQTYSSFHLYSIQVDENKAKKKQRQIYETLIIKGINVNLHYIPIYLQPYYQTMNFKKGYCPNAEAYFLSAISIPIFYELTFENQCKVIDAISSAFKS